MNPPKPDEPPAGAQTSNRFLEESAKAAPKMGIFGEFTDFLKHNKKWWLLPIIIVLLLVGALVLLGGSVLAPLIYPLF